MVILDYKKEHHSQVIRAAVKALKEGKVVAYPTDTSYGLAVDVTNFTAVKRLYRVKERDFNKPVHVVIPSLGYVKKVATWGTIAARLAKNFWPGPLTIVAPLKISDPILEKMGSGTHTIGLRYPDNGIAQDLAKKLGKPISATSANPSFHLSGGYDSYSAEDVITQFSKQKYKPDVIINAGKLKKRKPSTVIKVFSSGIEFLRIGPISKKQIQNHIS